MANVIDIIGQIIEEMPLPSRKLCVMGAACLTLILGGGEPGQGENDLPKLPSAAQLSNQSDSGLQTSPDNSSKLGCIVGYEHTDPERCLAP